MDKNAIIPNTFLGYTELKGNVKDTIDKYASSLHREIVNGDSLVIVDGNDMSLYTYVKINESGSWYQANSIKNNILDGKIVSKEIKNDVKNAVNLMEKKPLLAIVHIGNDPASEIYMNGKYKDCIECGIECKKIYISEENSVNDAIATILRLSHDESVTGIIIQLPLPDKFKKYEKTLINCIDPKKDVDGLTNENIGRLVSGDPYMIPCTPLGIMRLIDYYGINVSGKKCVIINRSDLVGKPLATMMTRRDATVTVCHSKTENIYQYIRNADILIVAVGKEKFITGSMIKKGAVVIDVGINRNSKGKVCGDVDFNTVSDVASYITPVPGGVGLMTRAMLLSNVVIANTNNK